MKQLRNPKTDKHYYLHILGGDVTCDGSIFDFLEETFNYDTSLIDDIEESIDGIYYQCEELLKVRINKRDTDCYGLRKTDYHMTFKQIGKELNITTERARQITAKAIRKLKHRSRASLFKYNTPKPLKKFLCIFDMQYYMENSLRNTQMEIRANNKKDFLLELENLTTKLKSDNWWDFKLVDIKVKYIKRYNNGI